MDDATEPPSAPPGRVCMSINSGKASAMAASDAVPRLPIIQTSVMLTIDWMKKATLLGVARETSSAKGGAVRRCRVRASIVFDSNS